MNDLLRILKTYEVWIYSLIGVVGIVYINKMIAAILEWKNALFGLEKEKAQKKISESTSMIILLLILAAGQFLLVSFISPTLSNSQALATPTMDLLATPTYTISPDMLNTQSVSAVVNETATPQSSGCITGKIEFTSPENGSDISGKVTLKGNVNVEDFGFYKYEYAQAGSTAWTTISAGVDMISNGADLGVWDTSNLAQGDFQLRLVVTDHAGNELTPCVIQVHVTAP